MGETTRKANLVMDANAITALLQGELGGAQVREIIDDPANGVFMHAVNLCEVFYDYARTNGVEAAREIVGDIRALPVEIRADMDDDFWMDAGAHKAEMRRVSLADCFCVALARRLGAELVTADRHEMEAIVQRGLCRVRFIR